MYSVGICPECYRHYCICGAEYALMNEETRLEILRALIKNLTKEQVDEEIAKRFS